MEGCVGSPDVAQAAQQAVPLSSTSCRICFLRSRAASTAPPWPFHCELNCTVPSSPSIAMSWLLAPSTTPALCLLRRTLLLRPVMLCCRISWALTFIVSLYKPKKERTFGSVRDLLYICLLFVALKLDGLAAYTWSVVFLIPWMWFGALFLGAIVVSGSCVPGGLVQRGRRGYLCTSLVLCLCCGISVGAVVLLTAAVWSPAGSCLSPCHTQTLPLPIHTLGTTTCTPCFGAHLLAADCLGLVSESKWFHDNVCCAVLCPADHWRNHCCICVHGPEGACSARWFPSAAAVRLSTAAILHLPLQLPGW